VHIFHLFSVILILRNSEIIIFVIKQILIIIFEIKFVYFWWVLIQILCLVHLRFSTWRNIWFWWASNSSWTFSSLIWMSWNSATRCWYTGRDCGCWSMIWNIHLISMLVQFVSLNFVMLFRIFRSLMEWPT